MQAPRSFDQGFASIVVPKDTGWSWSAATPNQITSTPSGTVFPNPNFTLQTAAVPVLSGKTVNIPYYLAAGSTTRKSLVFALIDLNKRGKLQSDLSQLAAKYILSGSSPATRDDRYARRIAVALDSWANAVPDYFMTAKNSASFISAAGFTQLTSDIQRASDHNGFGGCPARRTVLLGLVSAGLLAATGCAGSSGSTGGQPAARTRGAGSTARPPRRA